MNKKFKLLWSLSLPFSRPCILSSNLYQSSIFFVRFLFLISIFTFIILPHTWFRIACTRAYVRTYLGDVIDQSVAQRYNIPLSRREGCHFSCINYSTYIQDNDNNCIRWVNWWSRRNDLIADIVAGVGPVGSAVQNNAVQCSIVQYTYSTALLQYYSPSIREIIYLFFRHRGKNNL